MKKTKNVALCGIFTALCFLICYVGCIVTITKFIAPIVSGLLLIIIFDCLNDRAAIMIYVSVSILQLFVLPSKLTAFAFLLLFGYYPILANYLNKKMKVMLRTILKAVIFIIVGCIAIYCLAIFAPSINQISHFKLIATFSVLGYVTFVIIYDLFIKLLVLRFEANLKVKFDKLIEGSSK